MQATYNDASVQSDANSPKPSAHCSRKELMTHARQPMMLQIPKQVVGTSPKNRKDR